MATTTPAQIDRDAPTQQQTRVLQLVHAHRTTQATHRAAVAAEHPGPLAAAQGRLQAITTAIRRSAHPALAAALDAEASTGAVLQCLLTADDDTSAADLDHALADYQHHRAEVESLLPITRPTTSGPEPGAPRSRATGDTTRTPGHRPAVTCARDRSTRAEPDADI